MDESSSITSEQRSVITAASKHLSRLQKLLLQQLLFTGGMTGPEIERFLDSVRDSSKEVQLTGENRRKLIFDLRTDLARYFASPEGIAHPWKLSIPRLKRGREEGKYQLLPEPNLPPQTAEGFWFEHLTNGRGNAIILSQPYRFRESMFECGSTSISARANSQIFEQELEMRDTYRDMLGPVARGDKHAAHWITQYFQAWGQRHSGLPLRSLTTADKLVGGENLILLRSGEPYPQHTSGYGPFIRHVSIANASAERCDMLKVEPFAWLRQAIGAMRVSETQFSHSIPVVVVRYVEQDGRAVTLIEGAHETSVVTLAEALTTDSYVDTLIDFLELKPTWRGFPKRMRMGFLMRPKSSEAPELGPEITLKKFGKPTLPKNAWHD